MSDKILMLGKHIKRVECEIKQLHTTIEYISKIKTVDILYLTKYLNQVKEGDGELSLLTKELKELIR